MHRGSVDEISANCQPRRYAFSVTVFSFRFKIGFHVAYGFHALQTHLSVIMIKLFVFGALGSFVKPFRKKGFGSCAPQVQAWTVEIYADSS